MLTNNNNYNVYNTEGKITLRMMINQDSSGCMQFPFTEGKITWS